MLIGQGKRLVQPFWDYFKESSVFGGHYKRLSHCSLVTVFKWKFKPKKTIEKYYCFDSYRDRDAQ